MKQEQYEENISKNLPIRVTGYRIFMVGQPIKTKLVNLSPYRKKYNLQLKTTNNFKKYTNEVDINFLKHRVELLNCLKNNDKQEDIVTSALAEQEQVVNPNTNVTDHKEYILESTLINNLDEQYSNTIYQKTSSLDKLKNTQEDCKQLNNHTYTKKRKLKIKNIILVLLIMIFVYLFVQITQFFMDLHYNKKRQEKLIEEVIEIIPKTDTEEEQFKVNFDKLKEINPEVLGWIRYNQNKINYPIVKTKNNSYYLTHSFDQSYNQAGAIFMDYRNLSFDDKNVILFGHSMLDGTMFGSIGDLFNEGYFDVEENHYIQINNQNNEILTYQIFSYYIIEKEEYYITPFFKNDNEFLTFINTIKSRSYHDFGIEVSANDNILTLSTCHGTGNTTKRKVVHAKRIYDLPIKND